MIFIFGGIKNTIFGGEGYSLHNYKVQEKLDSYASYQRLASRILQYAGLLEEEKKSVFRK
jgi:hypothetical protein